MCNIFVWVNDRIALAIRFVCLEMFERYTILYNHGHIMKWANDFRKRIILFIFFILVFIQGSSKKRKENEIQSSHKYTWLLWKKKFIKHNFLCIGFILFFCLSKLYIKKVFDEKRNKNRLMRMISIQNDDCVTGILFYPRDFRIGAIPFDG